MKVKIGNYSHRWVSNIHDNYMSNKYGYNSWPEHQNKFEKTLEKLEDSLQWVYNNTINLILDKRESQSISVKIDRWDTWSMDHTLAHIILPMLKQLCEKKQGGPFVDDEDVPENIRSTNAPKKENDYDVDDYHFKRWDWVLDEMIWAFEQKVKDDWEQEYYKYESDPNEMFGLKLIWADDDGRKAHQERMSNGFRLFGKYYENLWT